jgi:hypothetical protein
MIQLLVSVLRKPEVVAQQVKTIMDSEHEFKPVAELARMTLASSSTNDYLEKIGAEAIGATHSPAKLGPDGYLNGRGIEVKPKKGDSKSKCGGVINDDTPMKLVKDLKEIDWIVFLNATKEGTRVNWCLVAPFKLWANARYSQILAHLQPTTWTWSKTELPTSEPERTQCLEDLVKVHKPKHYVRSSPLNLDIISATTEKVFWKHPDVPLTDIHPCLQSL